MGSQSMGGASRGMRCLSETDMQGKQAALSNAPQRDSQEDWILQDSTGAQVLRLCTYLPEPRLAFASPLSKALAEPVRMSCA